MTSSSSTKKQQQTDCLHMNWAILSLGSVYCGFAVN